MNNKTIGYITRIDQNGLALENEFGLQEFECNEKVIPFLNRYKVGDEVEASYVDGVDEVPVITFLSKVGGIPAKKPFKPFKKQTSFQNFPKKEEMTEESRVEMRRMSAIKSASAIYEGTGKEEEFSKLTEKLIKFIETGVMFQRV